MTRPALPEDLGTNRRRPGPCHRRPVGRTVLAAAAICLGPGLAVGAPAPASAPARPAAAGPPADADAKRQQEASRKWGAIVQFYGAEDTALFSLRVLDRDAKEAGEFLFKELWRYDRGQKRWVKMDVPRQTANLLPADQKPGGSPPDSQVLVDLPIGIRDVGLYYAKWDMNGVACASYMRLGPSSRERSLPGKPPPRHLVEAVPIDATRTELAHIPDPRYFTEAGPATAGPATAPAK